jgi:hypothetical protein
MASAAAIAPDESDVLCEGCGYRLNGLPENGNCPECGKPIEQSLGTHRQYTEFEASPSLETFFTTSRKVLFRPTQFYRTVLTRAPTSLAWRFALVHELVTALALGIAAHLHIAYLSGLFGGVGHWSDGWFWLVAAASVWLTIYAVKRLATRLSAWEAGYRGIRLPPAVIRRGLHYHSPHYLPVAFLVLLTVLVDYHLVWIQHDGSWQFVYLVTLCVEVVVGAVYLFITYWIAMKNIMYANR